MNFSMSYRTIVEAHCSETFELTPPPSPKTTLQGR
jgi:hypothetical protein